MLLSRRINYSSKKFYNATPEKFFKNIIFKANKAWLHNYTNWVYDTQHNDIQHNGTLYSVCCAECHLCWMTVMSNVTNKHLIMSVVILNVDKLSVIMLNAVAPSKGFYRTALKTSTKPYFMAKFCDCKEHTFKT